jgi:small subunit ribosomal protein S19e
MATLEILEQANLLKVNVSSVRDVSAAKFIVAYAAHLKKSNKLNIPEWVDIVKTGCAFTAWGWGWGGVGCSSRLSRVAARGRARGGARERERESRRLRAKSAARIGAAFDPSSPPLRSSAAAKELPPLDPDWYYVRAASIARRIYLNGGIGVGALAHWYGQAKSTKSRPEHFVPAARGLIRHILRNLQSCGLVEETEKGGRRMTPEGQKVRQPLSTSRPRFFYQPLPPRTLFIFHLQEADTIARNSASA